MPLKNYICCSWLYKYLAVHFGWKIVPRSSTVKFQLDFLYRILNCNLFLLYKFQAIHVSPLLRANTIGNGQWLACHVLVCDYVPRLLIQVWWWVQPPFRIPSWLDYSSLQLPSGFHLEKVHQCQPYWRGLIPHLWWDLPKGLDCFLNNWR